MNYYLDRPCHRPFVSCTILGGAFGVGLSLCSAFAGGGDGGGSTGTSPATVENRVTEADLTTITLTPDAIKRLAIRTEVVAVGILNRSRFFGGDTMVPPGRAIQLATPFAGTIQSGDRTAIPTVGTLLKTGDPILRLQPVVMGEREVLTPAERIALARASADFEVARAQADGDVEAARVQLEAARVRLERAKRLREENATSEKVLDEASADHALATANLDAAKAKAAAWRDAAGDAHADTAIALDLVAPFDGILADLTVTSGEVVGSNTAIARIVSTDPLWIRVPVYVGELDQLDLKSPIRIGALDSRQRSDMTVVERIAGPRTADAMTAGVDLYFRLENSDGRYRPQQRVGVWIPTRAERSGLIAPRSAVLHDIHGGTWVYEQLQSNQFARRRVEILAIDGNRALLSRGSREGMSVVTDGAAELFGVEFGAGK